MTDLVERTAIAPFELRGREVRVGQVVTLDRHQVKRLAVAGCVHESDGDNAVVPKADLPPMQRAEVEREAEGSADKLAAIRKTVADARAEADAAIEGHRARVVDAAEGVEKAEEVANKAIADHEARVTKAKEEADAAVKEHEQRAAKAEAEAAEKASKAKPSDKTKG